MFLNFNARIYIFTLLYKILNNKSYVIETFKLSLTIISTSINELEILFFKENFGMVLKILNLGVMPKDISNDIITLISKVNGEDKFS